MAYEGMNAEELGKVCYRRGFKLESNPFRDGTQESADFFKGWKKEHKEILIAAKRQGLIKLSAR